jgi:hypothetical protein
VDPVLLEELQVSITYLSQTNQVTFHNDVTSCYDCIIIAQANLVARHFGLLEEIARMHGITLEEMCYHKSTAIGISVKPATNTQPNHQFMAQATAVVPPHPNGYNYALSCLTTTINKATVLPTAHLMETSTLK